MPRPLRNNGYHHGTVARKVIRLSIPTTPPRPRRPVSATEVFVNQHRPVHSTGTWQADLDTLISALSREDYRQVSDSTGYSRKLRSR